MARRQLITIDVSFKDNWAELTTREILELLVKKNIKHLSITNVNKRKG